MARKEWIINITLLLIGAIFATESLRLGVGGARHPKPGFLPFFTGVALSVIGFYSLIRNFLVARREKGKDREKFFGQFVLNVGKIVVALIVYVLILPWLGYILSTAILLITLFKVGGFRRWAFILLYAFLTTLISYLLFSYCLSLRFPKGVLGF